jgi:hypothetical protein
MPEYSYISSRLLNPYADMMVVLEDNESHTPEPMLKAIAVSFSASAGASPAPEL